LGVFGRVWAGAYVDSITLMQVTEALGRLPGVEAASLVLATEANRTALAAEGRWPAEAAGAGPTDLVLAVVAAGPAPGRAALERADELLTARRAPAATPGDPAPRSIVSAARRFPEADLALISVPGPYAANEAHQALAAGLHVFLFSDDVPLEDEVALKRRARAAGRLLMGPECGTSLVAGVGLGFANRVRRGAVGLVGASGTGLQEVACLVDRLGAGVSHALGTGGRDLAEAVGGLTTLQALELLGADPDTRVLALVAKPGSPAVAARVLGAAVATGKPVVACLLGWAGAAPAGARVVDTLHDAAVAAVEAAGVAPPALARPPVAPAPGRRGTTVHALYTGGTLCEEARRIVGAAGHRFVDFGDVPYTRGRPHPMIDPALRSRAVTEAGDDPDAGVLLLDVVLGDGAHPDPAGALGPALREARARAARAGRTLDAVVHVVGTEDDPQALARQEASLRAEGAWVCPSNRIAAEVARDLVGGGRGR
jgi:succinyl-CoA synthetase alpha subunit